VKGSFVHGFQRKKHTGVSINARWPVWVKNVATMAAEVIAAHAMRTKFVTRVASVLLAVEAVIVATFPAMVSVKASLSSTVRRVNSSK
jgi:hypothetical protein